MHCFGNFDQKINSDYTEFTVLGLYQWRVGGAGREFEGKTRGEHGEVEWNDFVADDCGVRKRSYCW